MSGESALVVMATSFPWGDKETYMESESAYWGAFDHVAVVSLNTRRAQLKRLRKLALKGYDHITVTRLPKPAYVLCALRSLADRNLYKELGRMRRDYGVSPSRLVTLLVYLSRSHYEAGKVLASLRKLDWLGPGTTGVLYSYRFDYQPYVCSLVKREYKNLSIVCRAHGYDLYEDRRVNGYIPMREHLLESSERVYLIAKDGYGYLTGRYPRFAGKCRLSYLGTNGPCAAEPPARSGEFKVVSCSNVIPVKRVKMIAEALSRITDAKVSWRHYGEGEEFEDLRAFCEASFGGNIRYSLLGSTPNERILESYGSEGYNLFVNVSTSEGLPVSIMEAMSFGIPCIATDVGGTSEIVEDGVNGMLLPADVDAQGLLETIKAVMGAGDGEYAEMCLAARRTWEERFDARRNYPAFVEELKECIPAEGAR